MIVTDSNKLEAGVMDFVYVCRKQPFAVTCSPYLPKIPDNYVDLDLVLKMNIPMKNIQCTRQNYAGQNIRIVGLISQTIQCVVAGKALGTAHLKAKVVRDLNKLFNADCLAGQQLYDRLLDPSSLNTSKEAKNRSNKGISTFKQATGTKDVYTNVSTVIANGTCDDDDAVNSACDASDDEDLTNFLAMMTDDARAQAVEDYPELARLIKQPMDSPSNTSQEDDLKQFFAIQTKEYRAQAVDDYPELKNILQPDESLDQHPSSTDPVLAAIARKGIGPTDAYIMSINANLQSHTISSMPATNYQSRQPMVDTTPSALSYLSTSTSDLRNGQTQEISDDPLSQLAAQHGYFDDQDSHSAIMASHGYCEAGPLPDPDQVSLLSDTADYFCRLCQLSDQPDIVTFSHDLMDPSCPSKDYDDSFNEED